MANKKILLMRKTEGEVLNLLPLTSADNVMYDGETSVKEMIDSIILELRQLEKILHIDTLYMTGDDGVTLLEDDKGNNLVAVASLIGTSGEQ